MAAAPEKSIRVTTYIATALLWLATAIIGLAAVYYIHALSTFFYALSGGSDYWAGSLIGQVAVVLGGILWLVVVIASGEYHLKHAGEAKSWRLTAYILGIELAIILLGFFLVGPV